MGVYGMYLRKSRADIEAERRGEMETLSRHYGILSDLAKRMNIVIAEEDIYRELVSGESLAARPEIQRLLANIQAEKYAGIFVVEVERLARGDTKDQGTIAEIFKYTGTKIITPLKTYDPQNEFDEEYFEFGLFMSRREYKTILRRMQAGRLQSTIEGNFIGSIPGYGYQKIIVDGFHTLELNPEEHKVFRFMVDWFLYGVPVDGSDEPQPLGAYNIANRLDAMGYLTRDGKRWTGAKVSAVLKNPVNAGFVKWGWKKQIKTYIDGELKISRPRNSDVELYPGKHPAQCTIEEFEQIKAKFAASTRGYGGNKISNPLAHLLFCQCGKGMSRRTYDGPKQCKSAPRYVCVQQNYCHTKSVAVSDLLDKLYEALLILRSNMSVNLSDQSKIVDTTEAELAVLTKHLEELKATEEKLYDYLERGIYDEMTFIKRREKLITDISAVQTAIKEKSRNQPTVIDYQDKAIRLDQAISALKNDQLDAGEKNKFLKAIIQQIVYYRDADDTYHLDVFLL